MEYIIGIFIIIITLSIVGFYARKKIYQEVDRLELWKIDILNRPVTDEIAKVKELNMTGQTEVFFEQWRQVWDEIITTKLPEIEELLFDAQEYADKYRFKRAKSLLQQIEDRLNVTEQSISQVLEELNELIGSEEKNRIEVEELKEVYRNLKKLLLAHRHSYGKAEARLEVTLDEVSQKFKEFTEATKEGNYLEAREMVIYTKETLSQLKLNMDDIPMLLTECQSTLPNQLNELLDGISQMAEQGYILDHLQVTKEIDRVKKQLEGYLLLLEKVEIQEVKVGLEEIKESIETLYDLLEQEVEANQFVHKELKQIDEHLTTLLEESQATEEEILFVQQSYQLTDEDLETHRKIVKQLTQLLKQFLSVQNKLTEEHVAYTIVREELEEIFATFQELKNSHLQYCEMIQTLRKDELHAREKIETLQKKLTEVRRLIDKNNIPGLPTEFVSALSETGQSIQSVNIKLNERPLNMVSVNQTLQNAEELVEVLFNTTEEMIDRVFLAERVIQYGNRYRSRHKSLAERLHEAEGSFRNCEYQLALEQAATAIEELEPGALNKIEELMATEK